MSANRRLIDGPCSGSWNMAVDEVLLTSAIDQQHLSVRIYQWEVPTVSLGHFQPLDDPVLGERFSGLPTVRRLSGGGAILHDVEVTYSCAIPTSHPLTKEPTHLYVVVHKAIINVLSEHGVTARMRGSALNEPEPFLCFGRGDPRDIVIGSHKIVGSAQRRRSGAVLQHGAILLKASPSAPEFPGIKELTGIVLDPQLLSGLLSQRIFSALNKNCADEAASVAELSLEENLLAQDWQQNRYRPL